MADNIERKIYFYRWQTEAEKEFVPGKISELLDSLRFEDGSRYLEIDPGNFLCVWPVSSARNPRLVLGLVRRSGLPQLEDRGARSPLQLSATQGLVEMTHVAFYPNQIIGAEFNFYGPRPSRLPWYLAAKFRRQLPAIELQMLLRQDVHEQLDHMGEVKMVQLRLHRSGIEISAQADRSVFEMFDAAREASEAQRIELVLRTTRSPKASLGERTTNWIKALAGADGIRESAEVFKVRARDDRTNEVATFDLLRDQLVVSRQVVRSGRRDRAVDQESMFRGIDSAYRELREILNEAAGVSS